MAGPDPLAEYAAKRDFARTTEPSGKGRRRGKGRSGPIFMVQKHDATRLHFDLRLEVDGVLKSWAVTKGPSLDPEDKRLAVRTEDHPMAYATFEGTIPAGEYGGGIVMLWDRGTWQPVPGKSADDLDAGHLHFTLSGERMRGEWLLVRMKPRGREKRENWLLRKIGDAFAMEGDVLVERELTSIATGRTMAEIAADGLPRKERRPASSRNKPHAQQLAQPQAQPPAFRAPQLATLVDAVPVGNGWFHEIKFDGYRALIAAAQGKVFVYTRNGHDWTEKFGPLAAAIRDLDLPPCLIDGEIVAYGDDGNPAFSALQSVLKRGHGAQRALDKLEFHAFDLLELDGQDMTPLPNIERKERLEALLHGAVPPVRVADHVIGAGEKLLSAMCAAGQEGIISKRADAAYGGRRSKSWLKVKCTARQEFVIVGWTASRARGRPFASLLLAQYEGDDLIYRGKVGTGFGSAAMDVLAARFAELARDKPALDVPRPESRGARWIAPDLVAEIAYAEFTAEGRVRHASFLGLREDKPAVQVHREQAVTVQSPTNVAISSRDRVIFPGSGQTKGELADYYAAMATAMLPFVGNRPISLVRCPQGRARKCFFQKHDSGGLGAAVHHVPIREKDGGTEDYLWLDDADGLLQCVQMGTIEFHAWGSKADAVEQPDRMIFDLDPDEGLGFAEVKSAAADIRRHLADIGLVSFAMLSGGKGVHVVVPLKPGHAWDEHKDFSRRFAEALSTAEPERFTATMSKAKRKGRIFIDWLRNQRGATAVVPYSARARESAPVAVPITWEELQGFENAHPFAIGDAAELLERATAKALRGWGFAQQELRDHGR